MRIALVHDFLNQYGGAERVLEALHALYPEAPVYTSLYDRRAMPASFRSWDIRTSFLQRLPTRLSLARLYLACYPRAFEAFDLRGYDLILSSSSAFGKGIVPPPGSVHLCYCHNPARFLWDTAAYFQHERGGRLLHALLRPVLSRLRQWDLASNERVDAFVANSRTVADRIARFYGRESTVIHPPAAVSSFSVATEPGTYFLTGGRLVPHKRFDVAVEACTRLELPLWVYGVGRDLPRLQQMAGPAVRFRGWVAEEQLDELFRGCRAFLFPSEEDFGIAPIEAMACGRPVLAYAGGGALETVIEGKTGLFFPRQEAGALADVLAAFRDANFDPLVIRAHAERFDTPRFQEQIQAFVQECDGARSKEQESIGRRTSSVDPWARARTAGRRIAQHSARRS